MICQLTINADLQVRIVTGQLATLPLGHYSLTLAAFEQGQGIRRRGIFIKELLNFFTEQLAFEFIFSILYFLQLVVRETFGDSRTKLIVDAVHVAWC